MTVSSENPHVTLRVNIGSMAISGGGPRSMEEPGLEIDLGRIQISVHRVIGSSHTVGLVLPAFHL